MITIQGFFEVTILPTPINEKGDLSIHDVQYFSDFGLVQKSVSLTWSACATQAKITQIKPNRFKIEHEGKLIGYVRRIEGKDIHTMANHL